MRTPIVDLLNDDVPHMIAWCTPSILRSQRQVMNIYASGMSISYEERGNPEEPPWSEASGIFGEAYRLAAQAYWGEAYQEGQHHCLFSVNGSSGSNFMMMKALRLHFGPDLHILAQRNVHKSVIDACEDYRVQLKFLEPNYHPDYQIFMPNAIADFVAAVQADPQIRVVLISNPTYDGFSLDLPRLIAALRAIRPLVIYVDEAWGSNFYFDPQHQPPTALASGADIAVISTHKQGGSLQQTGIILWRDTPWMPSRETIFYAYRSLLTTSPSWHLLASIDASRAYMQAHGTYALRHSLDVAKHLKQGLAQGFPLIEAPAIQAAGSPDVSGMDKTKILVHTQAAKVSGQELKTRLEREHIIIEKSELNTILLLVPFQRNMTDADITLEAVRSIVADLQDHLPAPLHPMPTQFERVKAAYEVGLAELVPLEAAIGRVSAENITPYPPGVCMIVRGERVHAEHIAFIRHLKACGSTVLMFDNQHQQILVEK
jgi:lysine decarboxylase